MATPSVLKVGCTFNTYEELKQAVDRFEQESFVQLYIRSSRGLDVQRRRAPKKTFKEELEFGEIDYACIHGGRRFKSRSMGQRPNHSTFQMECPFLIRVRVTQDGQKLFVKDLSGEHNHEVSETLFSHLPQQRKMTAEEKEQSRSLLKLKVDRKLAQKHIRAESGKAVSLKDLDNVMGPSRAAVDLGLNLQDVVSELQNSEGSVTEVVERDGILQGIFYQRQTWRRTYSRYPELVLIDATHKLNHLGMPLYIVLAVDGNGESCIVAMWIVKSEDKATMTAMMKFLKAHNATSATKCFMADKDWTERGVIREEFPESALQICLSHTLRSFRREVTEKTMACSLADRNYYLDILSKLAYSNSQGVYDSHRQSLHETGNENLVEYFEKNWHGIRQEWVQGMKNQYLHLMNRTNNRLESLNQKIKAVLDRTMNLTVFVQELMACFDSFEQELERRASKVFQKVAVSMYEGDTQLMEYQKYLTPYAFTFVNKQHECSTSLHILPDSPTTISLLTSEGILAVTTENCSCDFFKAMGLPCSHVLALRKSHQLPLFSAALCAQRWSRDFYKGRWALAASPAPSLSVSSAPQRPAIPSQHQRYRMAFQVAQRLSSLASELPLREFQQALKLLEQIATAWEVGNQVTVLQTVGTSSASTSGEQTSDTSQHT